MSYRELRNFSEILKNLGYSRPVSLENFRSPNFPLVAEILVWLVQQFDPDYSLTSKCDTIEDRILLIRSVAEFMVTKSGLKLNMKKLYQADGHAVKEMLKIASLVMDDWKRHKNLEKDTMYNTTIEFSSKIQDLKLTREVASQIIQYGSSLFQMLSKEHILKEVRQVQANKEIDIKEVELLIKRKIEHAKKDIIETKSNIDNISLLENSLDMKIAKKQSDLERTDKRLEDLKRIRPAFLEEFEQLEIELKKLYKDYVTRFRSVAFLQQQLQLIHNFQEQQAAANEYLPQDTTTDKLHTHFDDTLSSPSPTEMKPDRHIDRPLTKKRVHGRIRTATSKGIRAVSSANKMYGDMSLKDESDDEREDNFDEDDLLNDGDSIFNNENNTDTDASQINSSDLEDIDDSKMSDSKSNDIF